MTPGQKIAIEFTLQGRDMGLAAAIDEAITAARMETLEFLLTRTERTGPRNHNDMVVPAEEISELMRDCRTKPWKAGGDTK